MLGASGCYTHNTTAKQRTFPAKSNCFGPPDNIFWKRQEKYKRILYQNSKAPFSRAQSGNQERACVKLGFTYWGNGIGLMGERWENRCTGLSWLWLTDWLFDWLIDWLRLRFQILELFQFKRLQWAVTPASTCAQTPPKPVPFSWTCLSPASVLMFRLQTRSSVIWTTNCLRLSCFVF